MEKVEKGQILLIVVLVMVVTLTIGLSIVAKTITNIKNTTDEENSQRAFSAAEAGIEQSMNNNTASSGMFNNNATYTTTITSLSGVEFLLNNGADILKDESADIWLSTYPKYTDPWSGNLTIYWGSSSDVCDTSEDKNTMAALEILLISGTKDTPKITHYAWDPCSDRSSKTKDDSNHFDQIAASSGNVSGKQFGYSNIITVNSGLIARVIPLYSKTKVGLKAYDLSGNPSTLPSQGSLITSTGVADKAQRKIVSFKSYPKLPNEIFPFILYTPK